jgi:NAD(P)-dependent dehydrogenase (short-subunit alcohol dehydrogenase family)
MGQVQSKVAIVTGGASGIGAGCAATLAREGAEAVVTDLDSTGGQLVVDKIGSAGGEAVFLHQDVSLEESWPEVIEATERRFGRLDVMVANAGIGIMCRAVEMSLADWRRQTAVNRDGVFLSVKYAVPALRRAGGGSTSSRRRWRDSEDRRAWPATALQREACGCLPRQSRWSTQQTTSGSIPCILVSSTRRSGRSYRRLPGATHRSIRMRSRGPGCRSTELDRRRTSPMACCSSPPTRRAI